VVRAALEGIAYQVREVLDAMSADAGISLSGVDGDGAMVANRFLMQFVADIARTEVRASRAPDLSALGAALAGELGTGRRASLDELASLPRAFETYSPAMGEQEVAANFEGWKSAVRRVL
jgi:glycerol kinase